MALLSHKSQVVCSFPSLHFAICIKWSCDLRQIIASFDAVCGATYFILFHVLIVYSKMLTPFKIL